MCIHAPMHKHMVHYAFQSKNTNVALQYQTFGLAFIHAPTIFQTAI